MHSFTDAELTDLEKHHRENAARGNAHFYGDREELDAKYVERQTKIANAISQLLEFRGLCDIRMWKTIEHAPKDGSIQLVYTASSNGLPYFISLCAYHPDAGWCTDEIRVVTHYMPSYRHNSFMSAKQ